MHTQLLTIELCVMQIPVSLEGQCAPLSRLVRVALKVSLLLLSLNTFFNALGLD